MSTDEVRAKSKHLLYSQYGPAGLIISIIITISGLSPESYERLKDFTAHLAEALNNGVGLTIIGYLIILYVNKSIIQPYLSKEKGYTVAVKDFEATLENSIALCNNTKQERDSVLTKVARVEETVLMLEKHLLKIRGLLENALIPKINKMYGEE